MSFFKMNNEIILTNMVMIYDDSENILVQNRLAKDWPGINFPGGHVKFDESIEESCIREIKEETGLEIKDLHFCGFYEWNIVKDRKRHLAMLYKTKKYSGNLSSSSEGKMMWIKIRDVNKYPQSTDFDKVLKVMLEN